MLFRSLLGTGTGSFGAATNFMVGTTPTSIINADFNGDGKADLATGNSGSNNVSVLLGTGTGSFGTVTNFTATTGPFSSLISADFDGDTKADLAVTDYSSQNVGVLLGTGTGSFGSATSFTIGFSPTFVTSADFNGDAKPDLATANRYSNNASVLLNCTVMDIANFNNEQEINIYPNPSNGSFVIETNATYPYPSQEGKLTVNVYDVNGKIVLSQTIQSTPNPSKEGTTAAIDASKLNEGVYNISISSNEGVVNKKLVIVR